MSHGTRICSWFPAGLAVVCLLASSAAPLSAQASLYSTRSQVPWDGFGARMEALGDINGDGVRELAVSCVGSGAVLVLSGADGLELYRLRGGAGFGLSLARGEFDGDGFTDLAVGDPLHRHAVDGHEAGAVFLHSGRDGSLICVTEGGAGDEHLGSKLFTVGDLDGGGLDDLFIGSADSGVRLFRTEIRSPVAASTAAATGARSTSSGPWHGVLGSPDMGNSLASLLGDLDGDGTPDWGLASSPLAGELGSVRLTLTGDPGTARTLTSGVVGDGFGWALTGLDDVDGDDVPDIAVGAPADDTLARDGGAVYVFSGRTSEQLAVIHGATEGRRLGSAVAGVGDVNGDGVADLCASGQEGAFGLISVFPLWPAEQQSAAQPTRTRLGAGGQ